MPPEQNLPTEVNIEDAPLQLVIGRSTTLNAALANTHLQNIRGSLPNFAIFGEESRASLSEALRADLQFVYFYCHGYRETVTGSSEPIPYLEIGTNDKIRPQDITTWADGKWPDNHWRTVPPLVFINGCHTTEITPELLVNFVETFVGAYAAGVVGTEISIHQRVAGEVAERFFDQLWNNKTAGVGEVLRRVRLHLLGKGNLLGLAYTPYCSTSLKYVGGSN